MFDCIHFYFHIHYEIEETPTRSCVDGYNVNICIDCLSLSLSVFFCRFFISSSTIKIHLWSKVFHAIYLFFILICTLQLLCFIIKCVTHSVIMSLMYETLFDDKPHISIKIQRIGDGRNFSEISFIFRQVAIGVDLKVKRKKTLKCVWISGKMLENTSNIEIWVGSERHWKHHNLKSNNNIFYSDFPSPFGRLMKFSYLKNSKNTSE